MEINEGNALANLLTVRTGERIECRIYGAYYHLPLVALARGVATVELTDSKGEKYERELPIARNANDPTDSVAFVPALFEDQREYVEEVNAESQRASNMRRALPVGQPQHPTQNLNAEDDSTCPDWHDPADCGCNGA